MFRGRTDTDRSSEVDVVEKQGADQRATRGIWAKIGKGLDPGEPHSNVPASFVFRRMEASMHFAVGFMGDVISVRGDDVVNLRYRIRSVTLVQTCGRSVCMDDTDAQSQHDPRRDCRRMF